jgi:hypothetical protein
MITAVVILVAIIGIAAYLTHSLDKDIPTTNEDTPTYTKEELENIKLAEELYNKDLRPIVAKKSKPAPELEVVEPEFVEKIVEIAKVFPEDALINLEEVKPVKKKRKYYPKKKK